MYIQSKGVYTTQGHNGCVQSISSGTNTCLPTLTICAIGTIGPICTLNEFWGTNSGKFINVKNGTFVVPLLTLADHLAENIKPRCNFFASLIILHQKDTFRNIICVQ